MPAKKFAISISEDVMEQVDQAAADRGWTRSRFIGAVLRMTARRRSDAAITQAIDALFSDPELVAEQKRTAAAFARISRSEGTRW